MSLSPKVIRKVQEIEAATAGLLQLEQHAEAISQRIRSALGYHFVAIQLTDPGSKVIRTIRCSDRAGLWYSAGTHPIDVASELRDIQAHVALQDNPPVIEIIKGWHPRFDRFIYNKFGHARYLRAFVPLIIMYNQEGSIRAIDPAEFTHGPEIPPVTCATEAHQTIRLQPRRSVWKLAVIGTVEAGFDCGDAPGTYQISKEDALQLFRQGCEEAVLLSRSTLRHVLQVVAASAREIAGAKLVEFDFSEPHLQDYQVWAGFPPHNVHETCNVLRIAIPRNSGEPLPGTLHLALPRPRNPATGTVGSLGPEEREALELFLRLAKNAISHAANYVNAASTARQLANLHEIAVALANEPDSHDLLETIAGYTANLLAADVVAIHELQNGACQETVVAGRTFAQSGTFLHEPPSKELMGSLEAKEIICAPDRARLGVLFGPSEEPAKYEEMIRSEDLCCGAAAVLRANELTLGIMLIAYRRMHEFSTSETYTIQTVASTAAVAIRNRSVARTRRRNIEILEAEVRDIIGQAAAITSAAGSPQGGAGRELGQMADRLSTLLLRIHAYADSLR